MNPVLPVYYQIKETIRSWIIDKEYSPGGKIPSENELAEKFKVSRLTVRQAISQLIQEGLLSSKRGEGTFVTDDENLIESFSLEFRGFMDDLFFHSLTGIKIKSVIISRVTPPKSIREKLALNIEDEEVIQIKRTRFLRDKLLTYTINYLPMEIGRKITEENLYKKPLLQILEEDLGIQFIEAVQTIEASFADQDVAKILGILSGAPILLIERIMYTKKHKPVEFFQSSYRGDLYKYIVRLKKTKEKDMWVHQLS